MSGPVAPIPPPPLPRAALVITRRGFRLTTAEPKYVWWILLGVARDVIVGSPLNQPKGTDS